ncbi:MAG: membrane protein insertase YidC [Campylobacteraceae bacterium]|jgi:YidC/Oxa1 family membrane protein insertase|nr:membrane protein insertase YidC [Campylobacteraceae bacterium]
MIDKMSAQNRVILATVLAILFFVFYSYYFSPQPQIDGNNTTERQSNEAPQVVQTTTLAAPVSTQSVNMDEIIAKVEAQDFEIYVDKLGRIAKYFLNGDDFKDENGERIQLIDSSVSPLLPLEIRFSDSALNDEAFFKSSYTADRKEIVLGDKPETLILTQELSGVTITKKITFTQDRGYNLEISLTDPKVYFVSTGFRPNVLADGYAFHGAIIKKSDDSIETIEDGDIKKTVTFSGASFAAASDRYYTTLLANFDEKMNVVVSPTKKDENPNIFIEGKEDLKLTGYIGPKSKANIHAVDKRLDDVIEYGFFTWISKPLFSFLYFIHSKVGNWGWSIVIITIIIRLILYPLTYRGMVSMNKLKDLAPKVKELQEKYKSDKQKLNAHVMDLYKKHGANPMGGCLPILIQIPIFFAIYKMLFNTIELKNAEWIFWVQDLAVKDPYYILPIAMGLTMFLQQKMTPTTFTDPTQEKVMKFLPLIFTLFFLWFPAGLTLYWFVNNLFSIFQQMYVNRHFKRLKEQEKEKIKQ